jgi:acetyltransferase-like isoleucine patch superfamily enzyme
MDTVKLFWMRCAAIAVVRSGTEIGANVVTGAGAAVTTNVPDGWIVAGNSTIKIRVSE